MNHFHVKTVIILFIIPIAFSYLFAYEELTCFSLGHALRATIRFNTLYFDTPQENLQDLITYTFFLMRRELEYPSIEKALVSEEFITYCNDLLSSYAKSNIKANTLDLLMALRNDLEQSLPVLFRFFQSASQTIVIDHYYFEVIQAYQKALQSVA